MYVYPGPFKPDDYQCPVFSSHVGSKKNHLRISLDSTLHQMNAVPLSIILIPISSLESSMLIKDVSLIQSGQLLRGRDILIQGNRIAKIGRDLKDEDKDETIDGHGKLAIPGLVNAHTHLAMTLFRGYADDMALMPWLQEKIWPLEAKLTEEDIHWGVLLGCLEQIHFGITCYSDMYYFTEETALATKEMGLRALLSGVVFDSQPNLLIEAERFIKRWKGDELITTCIGPACHLHLFGRDPLLG